ncbi:MAG: hypothetical protein KAV98_04255 [Dehalococcoidia bacterium]|nr:hypothetical protein [Dehalococcoidia bacterium]
MKTIDLVQIDGGHLRQFFMSLRAEGVAIFRQSGGVYPRPSGWGQAPTLFRA